MDEKSSTGARRLTRSQAAAALGASVATIRRLEGLELHPSVDADGVHWFDAAEVELVAKSRRPAKGRRPLRPRRHAAPPPAPAAPTASGEVAAAVFGAFDAGKKPSEVVVLLRQPPDLVRALHESWLELRARDLPVAGAAAKVAVLESRLAVAETTITKLVAASNANSTMLAGLPMPTAAAFTCGTCGDTGHVAVPVACTGCGAETKMGFWPPSA